MNFEAEVLTKYIIANQGDYPKCIEKAEKYLRRAYEQGLDRRDTESNETRTNENNNQEISNRTPGSNEGNRT